MDSRSAVSSIARCLPGFSAAAVHQFNAFNFQQFMTHQMLLMKSLQSGSAGGGDWAINGRGSSRGIARIGDPRLLPAVFGDVVSKSARSSNDASKSSDSKQQTAGPSQGRKRRRGVIEKRRRDRINSSLTELRRMVPSAFEKQGSQKLEKAEILQLAVQHLRLLSSRADESPSTAHHDPVEFHSMGFRFCASEVDEFLSNEGIELHDPLRMRLNNHLQCFGAQQKQSALSGQGGEQIRPSAGSSDG